MSTESETKTGAKIWAKTLISALTIIAMTLIILFSAFASEVNVGFALVLALLGLGGVFGVWLRLMNELELNPKTT